MHYIRFLKPPRVFTPRNLEACIKVESLITITSDLGESYYPEDVLVWANLHASSTSQEGSQHQKTLGFQWRARMRALHIGFVFQGFCGDNEPFRLQITTHKGELTDGFQISNEPDQGLQLPDIVSAWSMPLIHLSDQEVPRMVERRFALSPSHTLRIYEETGDSIARHIWDAGLALTFYISHIIHSGRPSQLAQLHSLVTTRSETDLRVLELGAGSGIVGLSLAHLLPNSSILLTDTSEAEALITQNTGSSLSSNAQIRSTVEFEVLKWEEHLPNKVAKQNFDLIIVSDCTYNPSSVPSLVTTLRMLVRHSPKAIVVVAMKMRHESENIFFELISKAGLDEVGHTAVPLPGALEEDEGKVDIYEYVGNED